MSSLPATFLSEEQLTCSICLEIFNNPVSTPCGHSFCQACITAYWEGVRGGGGGGAKAYQCPLCKESFRKLPELQINRTLKEITERFKEVSKDGVETDFNPQSHHYPQAMTAARGRGEMPQGIFAEMRTRFQHLNPNEPQDQDRVSARLSLRSQSLDRENPPATSSTSRRHSLSVLTESNESSPVLCPVHLKALEFFCRTDNTCVCSGCMETTQHTGHSILPAKREWLNKKSRLGLEEVELKDLLCARERKVEEIHMSLRQIQAAAEKSTEGTVSAFSKLISSMERCQAEVLEMIVMSQRAAEHRAQSLLKELEDEIAELRRRSDVLTQLAVSEDYVSFLETFTAFSVPVQTKDWSNVSVSSELTTGEILRTVDSRVEQFHEEMKKLPELCQRSLTEPAVPRTNPKIKRVQEYAADITLDPKTSHPRLVISTDLKQVFCGDRHQMLPDNPERFDRVVCVLARQGFSSGRHYWEVEVGGKTDWDLGVASFSVNRKGKITVSPAHGYWFLSLRDRTEFAFRTEPSTSVTVSLRPSRIGIYVDCDKGLVSFYNVDAKVLIYTFTDRFPDTIHPFFSPCTNKSRRNEAPLIICPVTMTE